MLKHTSVSHNGKSVCFPCLSPARVGECNKKWKDRNSSLWKVEKEFLHESANIVLLTKSHSLPPETFYILLE